VTVIQAVKRGTLRAVGLTVGRTSWGRQTIFRYIHRANHWGSPESASGPGSELQDTAVLRRVLPALLDELQVRTLVDIPCGDVRWLRAIDLQLDEYRGFDIVPELIKRLQEERPIPNGTFEVADLVGFDLPRADAILCRDVFLHMPYRDIAGALRSVKSSGSRFLLASTYVGVHNVDMPAGRARPIDLTSAPFSLPTPLRLIDEAAPSAPGKHLGVWEIAAL
jgi:hypothetical protein